MPSAGVSARTIAPCSPCGRTEQMMAGVSSRMCLFEPSSIAGRASMRTVTHWLRLCSRARTLVTRMRLLKLDRIEKARPRRFAERLDLPPPSGCEAAFPADFGRRFVVFGDAEEEFDWGAPLCRESTSTEAFAALPVATRFFGEHGVVPTYVCDWPVVTNPASAAALQAMAAAEACDVGAHLHPWVNPPHVEQVSPANSFAGSL